MEIFLQIILVLIIFVIIREVRVGVALFIAYSFLVPYCKLGFGELVLQQNLINTIIFLIVWIRSKHLDLKPFYAFVVFYILILFAIPFADGVSHMFQLDRWRSGVILNLFVPIALWNMKNIKNSYDLTRKFLVSVIITSCIYGLFLTTMHGVNPYVMFFYAISGNEYRIDWFGTTDRLFGRISSVFIHPMQFGMFLGCALIFLFSIRKKINTTLLYVGIGLVGTNIVICGIRSVLFAVLITLLFFLLVCRKFSIILGALFVLAVVALIVSQSPELSKYLSAALDITAQSDINGSSSDMRLSQLEGCFHEIRDCELFGKGFMWHEDYMAKNNIHPEILAFESLVFVILCDHGLFGFFIYGLMFVILYFTQRKYIKYPIDRLMLTCYTVFYITYCTLTGDYSYMKIWLIFYFLTFSEMYVSQK